MNILAIIAGIPVLVALYGVIRRQRFFFLLGYLLYALIVVPNELGEYMATGSMERLAVAVVWILQAILAFPNKLNYDGSKVFKSFGIKTFLSLAAINIFGVADQGHADTSRIHGRIANHDWCLSWCVGGAALHRHLLDGQQQNPRGDQRLKSSIHSKHFSHEAIFHFYLGLVVGSHGNSTGASK